ncbi:hypothetical protein DBV15_08746 [Temnothorax longispinosus]|uniref:Uncharacterized protein n=1 Tax=Temnothorax longispinosus TaxID=300112 RepID=A0A4S2KPS9_9HYME|nr:hypothetical protein DBV15_08746 [Temnothorax longispinosus]
MSFATCLGGQKLSKYARHKYRKEDSGKLSEHKRRGSLRFSRRKSTGMAASTTNPQGFSRRCGDNNLSIETAVLFLLNTRCHRCIIVTRPRKSSSGR